MKGTPVNVNGMHVTGDFQDEAGFPADWDPGTTAMAKETADTNIWSIVVNIPAFRHYEFKFINGIFGYEVEFVPIQSRVSPILNDNRWIYVDSLDSDTLEIGAIRFGGNAPFGYYLLRFNVDLQMEAAIDTTDGVHVAGDWQGNDPATTRMYSFDGNVYQYIAYIDSTLNAVEQGFKYANGNAAPDLEFIAGACATNNNGRGVFVTLDTVLPVVCFNSCSACTPAATTPEHEISGVTVYPVPADQFLSVHNPDGIKFEKAFLMDVSGREVAMKDVSGMNDVRMERNSVPAGMYLLKLVDNNGSVVNSRVIFN